MSEHSDIALNWKRYLDPELVQSAFQVNGELAWTRDGAAEAIKQLEARGRTIIGVDIWIVKGSTVSPVIFDWDRNIAGTDDRFPKSPAAFVLQFKWAQIPQDVEGDPYFNLTVA